MCTCVLPPYISLHSAAHPSFASFSPITRASEGHAAARATVTYETGAMVMFDFQLADQDRMDSVILHLNQVCMCARPSHCLWCQCVFDLRSSTTGLHEASRSPLLPQVSVAHEFTYHWYWMSFAHSATAATAGDVPAPAFVRPAASSDLSTAATACLCTAAVLPTAGQCAPGTDVCPPGQCAAPDGLSCTACCSPRSLCIHLSSSVVVVYQDGISTRATAPSRAHDPAEECCWRQDSAHQQ